MTEYRQDDERHGRGMAAKHSRITQILALLGVLAMALLAPAESRAGSMRVTLLGTGTPNPHPDRFGPATLVEAGEQRLLFDAGRGVTIRLNQFGYRVDYAGRSVVISGDTRFDQNVIEAAKGVDLLVHEVVAIPEALFAVNPAMKRVEAHHTTPEEVGTVMSEARPRLGVLTHYVLTSGPGIPSETKDELLARLKTRYSGPVVAGHDLMAIEVGESVTALQDQ